MRRAWVMCTVLAWAGACEKADRVQSTAPEAARATIDDGRPPAIDGDHNLIRNGGFEDAAVAPWRATVTGSAAGEAKAEGDAYCLDLGSRGDAAWDAQLRHRALPLQDGHHYVVEFTAWADTPTRARPRVGQVGPPYDEYWAAVVDLTAEPQRYSGHFLKRRGDDPVAELAFQLGGPLAPEKPVRICIDDVALSDPEFAPPPPAAWVTAPKIRVSQVGYLVARRKHATLRTSAREALAWELLSASGETLARGETIPLGDDAASGENVHVVDFSSHRTPGKGLRIRVDGQESFPFPIDGDVLSKLRVDAMAFFYHNRSGIPIEMPWAGGEAWVRPAGHPEDAKAGCRPDAGCKGAVDVSGGWYDAGDHGKYVVNAGISVWTLLSAYERAVHEGGPDAIEAFGDGTLAIPESKNGVPDLLDEVRWELEMLMRMQVPEGGMHAGMAYHKVHEDEWSPIPLAPHEGTKPRLLHRPSTAATLNLAAVAAQAARVWADIDPKLAKRCRVAAERAWKAANATPNLLAPGSDNVGGGPYDDTNLTDEFYWAAAELLITTGDAKYLAFVKKSPHWLAMPGPEAAQGSMQSSMTWQVVQGLGTMSLALVPSKLAAADRKTARDRIVAVADAYAAITAREGYRVPLGVDGAGRYPWGSNSLVLNNMVVLGLAHAFTNDETYLDAMADGMGYLLGRNPMSQSYVAGYGAVPLQNPHHRFWARQKDETYPPPPPGAVSGGPNSSVQDPYARSVGLSGCPAQKCFVDHIESWSTNEVAINWNAPLVWVTAYLDDEGR